MAETVPTSLNEIEALKIFSELEKEFEMSELTRFWCRSSEIPANKWRVISRKLVAKRMKYGIPSEVHRIIAEELAPETIVPMLFYHLTKIIACLSST